MTTMTIDLAVREAELNAAILEGDLVGALDRYYDEHCEMQENTDEPCRGKEANRAREKAFIDSVREFHAARLLASAVGEGVTLSEWEFDATYGDGIRRQTAQTSVRRWRNGLVIHERFYHS